MLSKFLITLIVIVIAFFVVRQRHLSNEAGNKPANVITPKLKTKNPKDELASDIRAGAYIFLVLMRALKGLSPRIEESELRG